MTNGLPEEVVPLLETVHSRLFPKDTPLDFWQIDHGPSILNGFMELAAQIQLALIDGDPGEAIPAGYLMLMALFSWEASAQADGWSQYFESSEGQIKRICQLYEIVGLPDEAEAIRRARAAVDNGAGHLEVAGAYGSQLGDLDRLEYLTEWFCDNSEQLLYRD